MMLREHSFLEFKFQLLFCCHNFNPRLHILFRDLIGSTISAALLNFQFNWTQMIDSWLVCVTDFPRCNVLVPFIEPFCFVLRLVAESSRREFMFALSMCSHQDAQRKLGKEGKGMTS